MALETDSSTPSLADAQALARGIGRMLGESGFASLTEFPLKNRRRVDVLAIGPHGEFVAIEIKTSRNDFVSDSKWGDYLAFCDRFYFAVPAAFPDQLIPVECGLIVADAYGAAIVRENDHTPMNTQRRKALTLRFARLAASRLRRTLDPGL